MRNFDECMPACSVKHDYIVFRLFTKMSSTNHLCRRHLLRLMPPLCLMMLHESCAFVRLLSFEHCTSVRRQQTALQGHRCIVGSIHMSRSKWIQKHTLQETALQIPYACALQGSLAVLNAQTLSQLASDIYACITCRVELQNHLVVYHHTQQHLGQQHKYECSATFTCSAACMATVTIATNL